MIYLASIIMALRFTYAFYQQQKNMGGYHWRQESVSVVVGGTTNRNRLNLKEK